MVMNELNLSLGIQITLFYLIMNMLKQGLSKQIVRTCFVRDKFRVEDGGVCHDECYYNYDLPRKIWAVLRSPQR